MKSVHAQKARNNGTILSRSSRMDMDYMKVPTWNTLLLYYMECTQVLGGSVMDDGNHIESSEKDEDRNFDDRL